MTGTEVLTGRVQDRNGPWLADRLLELGVELRHITLCGDRPADIEAQLRFLADQGVDLIITSGGLGPTADDMTVEIVARFCARELVLDAGLEAKIADIVTRLMARYPGVDAEAVLTANRKQALVPAGAVILEPSLRKLDTLAHIAARLRGIILQSAIGGIALSLIAIAFAATGHLSPVYGALLQEFIDLAAILNALRAAFAPKTLADLQ